MRPTDLALNQTLGIQAAPPAAEPLKELPPGPFASNQLGPVDATAQFAWTKAARAERLRCNFAGQFGGGLIEVRGATPKYRPPVANPLRANSRVDRTRAPHLAHDRAARFRLVATVLVEWKNCPAHFFFAGIFDWFVGRPAQLPV